MVHPRTKLAWLFVGGTIALATIWAFNNAESEVQLACKQADTGDVGPRRYECVDEQTGQRKVFPEHIDKKVGVQSYHPVGRYAYQLNFSDSHNSGVYSFDYLRDLDVKIQSGNLPQPPTMRMAAERNRDSFTV